MFVKVTVGAILLMAAVVGIGIAQDYSISLANTLRNCKNTSDNSGYIGYQCPGVHYYIPASERDQLPASR